MRLVLSLGRIRRNNARHRRIQANAIMRLAGASSPISLPPPRASLFPGPTRARHDRRGFVYPRKSQFHAPLFIFPKAARLPPAALICRPRSRRAKSSAKGRIYIRARAHVESPPGRAPSFSARAICLVNLVPGALLLLPAAAASLYFAATPAALRPKLQRRCGAGPLEAS